MTLAQIDDALKKLEEQYLHDRETLERLRASIGRLPFGSEDIPPAPDTAIGTAKPKGSVGAEARITRGRTGSLRKAAGPQPRSKRDTMRAITVEMEGTFTVNDLEEAAARSSLQLAPTLNKQDWSSCLWQFYKQGLLEMVEPRRGNLPAVYRLKTKDLSPPPVEKESDFPLQEMVWKAVEAIKLTKFGRKEVFTQVVEMNPDHADRVTIESVSAVLNRISRFENSPVKTLRQGFGGNVYTHSDN